MCHRPAELAMELRHWRAALDYTVKIHHIEQEMLQAKTDQLRTANADLYRWIAMRRYRTKYVDDSREILSMKKR